ncbi:hypothetical protein [uncultured Desulfobacter sp.]|uniref:hypothetical protein n=1 Tax=uncultured Desulfobacter sp. TaxID=240139 RepID=UPI0029F56FAA|nr:hypothetical protein [uncultured Desulfobacter sp.]
MGLDWDILLDGVSIKDQIARFEVRDSAGSYARELTLEAADPSFYDQFTYTVLPQLRLEVKVKDSDAWVSLGKFYVEQPGISADPDQLTNEGLWGRSETAKAGAPFAPKVSKSWEADTTAAAIVSEMAALADLTVSFQMTDYTVFAGSYSVDGVYPIDVINELAAYAGGTVGCTAGGALVVRSNTFHPAAADHIVTDLEIIGIIENVEYPEFGNRIKISADGSDSGLSVTLAAPDDADCLPADGSSKSKLYAFVSDNDGPVEDGVVVTWTAESGVTLGAETSATGQMLISNKVHNADNYYTVTVDYPVKDVVGIWAYSDRRHENNFWNTLGSFEDNEITVYKPFAYCDQTLVVTYITSGCAVNTVTAGTAALDVTVTADVNGSQGAVDVKLGNTCACGSSLDAVKSTDTDICFGNSAPILIWAEINGGPATGMIASLTLTGCGSLSSTKKILGAVKVVNEIGYVINEISEASQVECAVYPADSATPKVYLTTDTGKSDNLYQSHDGKVIDLEDELDTGAEVWIDYTADGAAVVSWLSENVDDECDADILIKIADGTEGGLSETISMSATDCTTDDSSSDATSSDYSSDDDPNEFDNDGTDGGESDDESNAVGGGVTLDACDVMILNRMANIDNATAENKDDIRFGVSSSTDCTQEDPYGCPCSELCESEIRSKGNTYDYNRTIHETVIETYAENTSEYNEAYAILRAQNLAECEEKCEYSRAQDCGGCNLVSGPGVLSPGESAEYVCSDGTLEIITMPEDGCGTLTFTVGCCVVEVRSTEGTWVYPSGECSNATLTDLLIAAYTRPTPPTYCGTYNSSAAAAAAVETCTGVTTSSIGSLQLDTNYGLRYDPYNGGDNEWCYAGYIINVDDCYEDTKTWECE